MSRRQNLEQHRQSLTEIREIMNSMKTLAYMETRKLAPYLDSQKAVVQTIETVAADFLKFHPGVMRAGEPTKRLLVLVGSERGFCGDFNRVLVNELDQPGQQMPPERLLIIVVGTKLQTLLEEDPRVVARINGASTAEEVRAVLNELAKQIISLQSQHGPLEVSCLYHGSDDGLATRTLLPPFQNLDDAQTTLTVAPVLNMDPPAFLLELSDQYLFAALQALLYTSMLTENHDRVRHLDGAVRHIDDQSEDMKRQYNALRQEEIIEEIEVILLSAASITGGLAGESTRKGQ